ncbi:MAG: hypothetical protein B6245_15165 [Desulfobacteraceae bacterium 4572_88]|nr:MAG: hypothetical protein B6245_15165 [Desulfobacteraceae bacterium 4572_88]
MPPDLSIRRERGFYNQAGAGFYNQAGGKNKNMLPACPVRTETDESSGCRLICQSGGSGERGIL